MTNHKIHTKGLFIGQNQIYLPSCQSTNESLAFYANEQKTNAKTSIFEGTLLWTNHQTQGKGQRGNTWTAQENQNLTFSILLNPTFLSTKESFWITIAVSLGVRDALEAVLKIDFAEIAEDFQIKWTNDIFINHTMNNDQKNKETSQKIGGILIENQISSTKINQSIIGIGININQIFAQNNSENDTTNRAISLKELTNKDWNKEEVLTEVLFFIEKRYLQLRAGKKDSLRADYLSHLFRYQEWHYYKDKLKNRKITGQILGINPEGKLALEIAGQSGKISYFENKEIEFLY
ncbi:MAG: biotin--[acetyl-CoA-carboxylase] ligase [Flexibacter sp. CG_4_10_14_3_um_filter_32_15]|nr:MAG: biotin--[acetyl-CoA-carboxylase] ligase [Flexibacter sp. CG_4_10_14_3_um_filter_32_15]